MYLTASVGGSKSMTNEILIVDDEDRIRRLLKLYLERESFEIHEARVKKPTSLLLKTTMRASS